jgi:hypothetical protein
LRKYFAVVATLGGLFSISCFAESVFLPVEATPYDRQMTRVRPVLASTNELWSPLISPLAVNQWMVQLRAMPYRYSKYWQTPAEVAQAQTADCKGKAVALYAQMRLSGATNVRVVIGKHHIYDIATHAWLEWRTTAGSYLLDPTFNEHPVNAMEVDPLTYLPFYAYDNARRYRVDKGGFVAPTSRVATGTSNRLPVSVPTRVSLSSLPVTSPSLTTTRFETSYLTNQNATTPPLWPKGQRAVPIRGQGFRQVQTSIAAPPRKTISPPQPIAISPRTRLSTPSRLSASRRGKNSRVRTAGQRGHPSVQVKTG